MNDVDEEYNRWSSLKQELRDLQKKNNYMDLFLRRKEFAAEKDRMKKHTMKIKMGDEDCLLGEVKERVYERVFKELRKLDSVVKYATDDSVQAFDELLEIERVEELREFQAEQDKFCDREILQQDLVQLNRELNAVLRDIEDSPMTTDYANFLDDNTNPMIRCACKNIVIQLIV